MKPKTSDDTAGGVGLQRMVRRLAWYLAPLISAATTFAATLLAVRVMDDFGFQLTALCFCSIWWPLVTFVTRLAHSPNDQVEPLPPDGERGRH